MIVKNDPRVDKQIRLLQGVESARIIKVIDLFHDYGFKLTEVYLKKLTKGLWELRTGRWRLLLGIVRKEAIIVNMFHKKTQKAPKKEIDLALKRLREYL